MFTHIFKTFGRGGQKSSDTGSRIESRQAREEKSSKKLRRRRTSSTSPSALNQSSTRRKESPGTSSRSSPAATFATPPPRLIGVHKLTTAVKEYFVSPREDNQKAIDDLNTLRRVANYQLTKLSVQVTRLGYELDLHLQSSSPASVLSSPSVASKSGLSSLSLLSGDEIFQTPPRSGGTGLMPGLGKLSPYDYEHFVSPETLNEKAIKQLDGWQKTIFDSLTDLTEGIQELEHRVDDSQSPVPHFQSSMSIKRTKGKDSEITGGAQGRENTSDIERLSAAQDVINNKLAGLTGRVEKLQSKLGPTSRSLDSVFSSSRSSSMLPTGSLSLPSSRRLESHDRSGPRFLMEEPASHSPRHRSFSLPAPTSGSPFSSIPRSSDHRELFLSARKAQSKCTTNSGIPVEDDIPLNGDKRLSAITSLKEELIYNYPYDNPGRVIELSAEAEKLGKPWASFFFCVTSKKEFERLDSAQIPDESVSLRVPSRSNLSSSSSKLVALSSPASFKMPVSSEDDLFDPISSSRSIDSSSSRRDVSQSSFFQSPSSSFLSSSSSSSSASSSQSDDRPAEGLGMEESDVRSHDRSRSLRLDRDPDIRELRESSRVKLPRSSSRSEIFRPRSRSLSGTSILERDVRTEKRDKKDNSLIPQKKLDARPVKSWSSTSTTTKFILGASTTVFLSRELFVTIAEFISAVTRLDDIKVGLGLCLAGGVAGARFGFGWNKFLKLVSFRIAVECLLKFLDISFKMFLNNYVIYVVIFFAAYYFLRYFLSYLQSGKRIGLIGSVKTL